MFAELRLSFANDRFFDRLFSELPWIRENFVLLPGLAECFIHTTNLETGRLVLFSGSPIARRSQCCMHDHASVVLEEHACLVFHTPHFGDRR